MRPFYLVSVLVWIGILNEQKDRKREHPVSGRRPRGKTYRNFLVRFLGVQLTRSWPPFLNRMELGAVPRTLRVGVFGSSSNRTPDKYKDACRELGRLLAERKHVCVNGGGKYGCMGAVNEGVIKHEGESVGVIHKMWIVDIDEKQEGMTDMLVADGPNLVERKRLLFENSDCFIIMPGGPGTFDEMWETISDFQLGFSRKPVVLVNVDGYYDGTILQLQRAEADGILHKKASEILRVCDNVLDAIKHCERESLSPILETTSVVKKRNQSGEVSETAEGVAGGTTSASRM